MAEHERKERIASVVEGTWGKGIVYDLEPSHHELPPVSEIRIKSVTSRFSTTSTNISGTELHTVKPSDTAFDDTSDYYCLPYFQASLFATVLEDTVTQLRILVECNNEMRITKTMADLNLLRALKYGVLQLAARDDLDGIDPHKLGCLEYKLNKLDADRNYFGDVMVSTYVELSLNKCFKILVDRVHSVMEMEKYIVFLTEDEAKNRNIRRDLAKQLRLQRNHIKSVIYDADVIIDGLKTQVEDAALMAETRSRYVQNWQSARTEQHRKTIHEKESVNTDSIEYFKLRIDHEQRVHSEMELLTNIAIDETLQKVEEWMEKYEKDIEAIDLKIQIKKSDYQTMLEKRIGLENTIEKHDRQMKAWIAFKDEREKALQYHNKMTQSAIIVQAWWRGLLVRRELGPYRRRKKKGFNPKK